MANLKKPISRAYGLYRGVKTALERAKPLLRKRARQNRFNREAQAILQTLSQEIQQTAHLSISQLVTECLNASFPDPYEFKLEIVKKRGKTEAHLNFWKNEDVYIPTEESGGGVLDVAAFGLRLACVMLRKDVEKVLVLDEPFKMVGEEDADAVREMLWDVSTRLEVQIILVTHNKNLVVGKEIKLKRKPTHVQKNDKTRLPSLQDKQKRSRKKA